MLKSPTINSSYLTSTNCSIYDDHSMAKFSYLNPFFRDGGGLYTTTSLVESLFTLIRQSNSSNLVISCVGTMFQNEMSFFINECYTTASPFLINMSNIIARGQ